MTCTHKEIAESLILSKLDYRNDFFTKTSLTNKRRMQKCNLQMQRIPQKYATESDILRTKWLPIEGRIKYSICQMAHLSITDKHFPAYLRLEMKKHILHLRENKIRVRR